MAPSPARIVITYSSSSGRTRGVVERMARLIEPQPDTKNLTDGDAGVSDYEFVILGTPTYGQGEVHYPWTTFLPTLRTQEWRGRSLALFALGDQRFHGKTFAGGLWGLYLGVRDLGAQIIGEWPVSGYVFESSPSARPDGTFPGLVLDEINQRRMTDDRLKRWVDQIQAAQLP